MVSSIETHVQNKLFVTLCVFWELFEASLPLNSTIDVNILSLTDLVEVV